MEMIGKTKSTKEEAKENEDLSIDTLVQDFTSLLTKIFPDSEEAPTLLVRHTLSTLFLPPHL